MKKADAIMACKYFHQESHDLNKHSNFSIINQLKNTSKSIETPTQ